MQIKGCIDQKDLESLKKGEEHVFYIFFDLNHLRLWPEKYIPATMTIDAPEPEMNAHVPQPFRGVLNDFYNAISKLKEGS